MNEISFSNRLFVENNNKDVLLGQQQIHKLEGNLAEESSLTKEIFNLTDLDAKANYSELQTSHKQICNARLKSALQLLSNPSFNISEVAFMAGFNDPKYFSTCFKNKFGLSPKDYRLNQLNTNDKNNNLFLNKAINIIESKFANTPISADQFASEMNVSKSTLYRKILSATGMSPCDFIRNIKINMAKQLLDKNKSNISEVAFAVGFNDTKYFSRCFKAEHGVTPQIYKVQIKAS